MVELNLGFFVVVLFSINQSILYQDVRVLLEHSNLLDVYSGNFKSISMFYSGNCSCSGLMGFDH